MLSRKGGSVSVWFLLSLLWMTTSSAHRICLQVEKSKSQTGSRHMLMAVPKQPSGKWTLPVQCNSGIRNVYSMVSC